MDFLDELIVDNGIVEREFTFNGKTGAAFFRRINGAQKLALVKGKKYAYTQGDGPQSFEIDLEDNERTQQLLVQFAVVDPTGKPKFKTLADVQKLDAQLLNALHSVASEVNKAADNADASPGEA